LSPITNKAKSAKNLHVNFGRSSQFELAEENAGLDADINKYISAPLKSICMVNPPTKKVSKENLLSLYSVFQ